MSFRSEMTLEVNACFLVHVTQQYAARLSFLNGTNRWMVVTLMHLLIMMLMVTVLHRNEGGLLGNTSLYAVVTCGETAGN